MWSILLLALAISLGSPSSHAAPTSSDPCADIAGQTFVPMPDLLACQRSFPFNETLRQNILTVISRVFDFYTFEDYYLDSPPPFQESTANIRAEISRINSTQYDTDYDFNQDLYNTINQLNDGHTIYLPNCYTSWQNLIPTPPVSLSVNGTESVFIAPDTVAFIDLVPAGFSNFYASINFNWQRLAGARVTQIEGMDPYAYADQIADKQSGNYLDHNVRVNSVWTGYRLSGSSFSQKFGVLAGQVFSSQENLTFSLIPVNSTEEEQVTVPYLAVLMGNAFTDQASYWENNCAALPSTNGVDRRVVSNLLPSHKRGPAKGVVPPRPDGIGLPVNFQPTLPPVSDTSGLMQSYILEDGQTGVMFVGSFDGESDQAFQQFQTDVKGAITAFQKANVTRLIIDVTENDGGIICLGIFLHGFLAGSNFGYAGFESDIRATPFAQKLVQANIDLGLQSSLTFYAPDNYAFLNDTPMPDDFNYIDPSVPLTVNGQSTPTSQRLHEMCDFSVPFPPTPSFDFNNIAIVSDGNCASTCAQFSTVMNERHNVTLAVFGGKSDINIEFKGMAGLQVLEWSDIDSEIKTAGLKNDPMAPPDLLVSADMRHNWRTGENERIISLHSTDHSIAAYSFLNESQPIQYRSELPKLRFPYTPDTYNNPQKLWEFAASQIFG
ncbi:hypothetical protein DENSPDRAFT_536011 [Dentipellis sp. KUC8613]|nr:hypothetical protein DENSPDRAFT_536011 [Dentipellis sp. KUC8613]